MARNVHYKDKAMIGIMILFVTQFLLITQWSFISHSSNLQQAIIGIPTLLAIFFGSYWISTAL